jgi:hypothetical protein
LAGLLVVAATSIALTFVVSGNAQAAVGAELRSEATGKCIDAKSEDVPWNAQVQQWDCHARPEQNWTIHRVGQSPSGRPLVILFDNRTLGCMTMPSVTLFTSGADVRMMPCNNTTPQQWEAVEIPFDTQIFSFVQSVSGMCLDLRGGSDDNGAHIQQFRCNGTGAQRWHYQPF